jgi:hypothetical protein
MKETRYHQSEDKEGRRVTLNESFDGAAVAIYSF